MKCTIWLTIVFLAAGGCGGGTVREQATAGGRGREETLDTEMSYLAACRAILGELRRELVENALHHEIWPDIEESNIYVSHAGTRGVAVLITIRATGPNHCRVTVFCTTGFWREHVMPAVEKALAG